MHPNGSRPPHRSRTGHARASGRAGAAEGERTTPREEWHDRAATKIEERIFHIQDAAERGGDSVAAGLHAEGITLARVDAAGKDDARSQPAAFKEGELVAVTRYGDVHHLNPKYIDLKRLQQSACGSNQPAPLLSDTLEFFATNRAAETARSTSTNAGGSEKRQDKTDFRDAAREVTNEAKGGQRDEAAQDIKRAALTVTDTATGAVSSLSSFVESLLGLAGGGAPPPTKGDMEIRQQLRALAALEDIRECIERGESLSSSDIAHLPHSHLVNLKYRGDDYMRELVEDLERDREREEDDYSRSR